MPEKAAQFRFRADWEDRSARFDRTWPPSVWLWLCLIGACIGGGAWYYGRLRLVNYYSQQLSSPDSKADALAAINGLLKLDADAIFEIVNAIESADDDAAMLAFGAIDQKLSQWESLDASEQLRLMRNLAGRLEQLPESISKDRHILAGALASRMLSFTLRNSELSDPNMRAACQNILLRMGRSALIKDDPASRPMVSPTEQLVSQGAGKIMALSSPPPPLPPEKKTTSQGASNVMHLSDVTTSPTAMEALNDSVISSVADAKNPAFPRDPARQLVHQSAAPESDTADQEPVLTRGPSTHPATLALTPGSPNTTSFTVQRYQTPRNAAEEPSEPDKIRLSTGDELPLARIGSIADSELLKLLSHPRPRVSQVAALELRKRGMNDQLLQMAGELAAGTAEMRMRILDDIVRVSGIDPRPWLLWMAQDGEPSVRRKAVSMLASLSDTNVNRQLRLLLNRERDEEVAQALRQALVSSAIIR